MIELAESLRPHDGAAALTGAVDAADHLTHADARQVVAAALASGHKSARKAALERLCAWGEQERAVELAAADHDASIRRWADKRTDRPQPRLFD